ncbi:MAG TPA: response regulator [Flavobacteriales bacterium]|nr:response regulator [Flavobacteriales bacterium]
MKTKQILVIEHERMIFLDIKVTFAQLEYEVVYASKHNLETIANGGLEPALIVADVQTCLVSLRRLYRTYRSHEALRKAPVIFTNSGHPVFNYCMGMRMNVIKEVAKPYNVSDLVDVFVKYNVTHACKETIVKGFTCDSFVMN